VLEAMQIAVDDFDLPVHGAFLFEFAESRAQLLEVLPRLTSVDRTFDTSCFNCRSSFVGHDRQITRASGITTPVVLYFVPNIYANVPLGVAPASAPPTVHSVGAAPHLVTSCP
jgi:hypothetical protein